MKGAKGMTRHLDVEEFLDSLDSDNAAEPVVTFGKHKGTPLADLDHGYLRWMLAKAAGADAWEGLVRFVATHRETINQILSPQARAAAVRMDYRLSQSQADAVATIERDLLMGEENLYRLEGGAGYGKSFAVLDLVRVAMHHGYEVNACATSYVATQVLCEHLEPYGIEPRTIASQLRLDKVELEDQESYEISLETGERLSTLLSEKHLLIVDEYSMVGDEIADMLMDAACSRGGKLLVVGDLKQLPPVGQNHPTSFIGIQGGVTLTQPMRYPENSDLYALEQLARATPREVLGRNWGDSNQVVVHPHLSSLVQQYVHDYRQAPAEDARLLFYRRKDVLEYNAVIRAMLFGSERASSTPIIEDEALMVTATTDVKNGQWKVDGNGDYQYDSAGNKIPDTRRYYSGTSFLVDSVREGEEQGVPCYLVRFHGTQYEVPVLFGMGQVLNQDSLGAKEYQETLSQLRDEAIESKQWNAWRQFKNSFLPVSHRYATTVHRSQGASIDRAYFAPARLQGGAVTDKLLYVAATRAKKVVHIAPE